MPDQKTKTRPKGVPSLIDEVVIGREDRQKNADQQTGKRNQYHDLEDRIGVQERDPFTVALPRLDESLDLS